VAQLLRASMPHYSAEQQTADRQESKYGKA
jgi:hypothetical protein